VLLPIIGFAVDPAFDLWPLTPDPPPDFGWCRADKFDLMWKIRLSVVNQSAKE
jgi:hypothetical protein